MRLTETAHRIVSARLRDGDHALDATAGNGHDCLFLARSVGETGRIIGFDLQWRALRNTRRVLERAGVSRRVRLVWASHHRMQRFVPAALHGEIRAVMFNLGYLPGSDKAVVTRWNTTIEALEQALELLAPDGILSVIAYPGHPEGSIESARVQEWFREREVQGAEVRSILPKGAGAAAPRLLLLHKAGRSRRA